tara:strand:- start:3741 stop:4172 length:432 start_codon:yes stop_codon:yes gene_type:complete
MKKSELKTLLKPLIKECIQETLLEGGLLSNVISEVVKGLGGTQQLVVEETRQDEGQMKKMQLQEKQKRIEKLNETRKGMLDAIGRSSYNGVDLFEGTTPIKSAGGPDSQPSPRGPLANMEPDDPGVDISRLMGNSDIWKAMIK